jgi:two-component system sensor histidine kinase ChvG
LAIATGKARTALSLRRVFSRLWIRLLAFNVLLVFLPAAGISYLAIYERKLLQAQEDSMVQQGRLLAAALSERGVLDVSIAEPILARLERQTPSRIRVLDKDGWLLCDTSRFGPPRGEDPEESEETDLAGTDLRSGLLYRLGSGLFRLLGPLLADAQPEIGPSREEAYSPDVPFDGIEIRQALAGGYGAATRITRGGQRSVTLYSALPVRNEGEVAGVVLVSQSTFHILRDLYEVRLAVFRYVLGAAGVAAVLSLMLSATISRPIEKLRSQAKALVDRRGRLVGSFPGSNRFDEIGDLSRALSELSSRLEERMKFIESFAADVSHEFKNPLTSIRAAAEMLKDVEDPGERARFAGVVEREIARLERLLSTVREVTLVDSALEDPEVEAGETAELGELLRGLTAARRYRERGVGIDLETPPAGLEVRVPGHRLAQIFENLLDNAMGFTPDGGRIRVEARAEGKEAVVRVEDQGPGVPEEHRERIFDRFFTYRPGDGRAREHTGLGLAIVKAVVERYGGSVSLVSSSLGGAGFEVRLRRL